MYKLLHIEDFHHMHAFTEKILFDDGSIVERLVSYTSVVCDVDLCNKQVWLYPRHRYSITTTRQVTRFLSEQLGFLVCAGSLDDWQRQEKRNGYAFENGFYINFPVNVLGTTIGW
jgi:hypothetical protein